MSRELFIGLMSGTSLDGIDAVLVSFDNKKRRVFQIGYRHDKFSNKLRNELLKIINTEPRKGSPLYKNVDDKLTKLYISSVLNLIRDVKEKPENISAIGCHGQTINHQPNGNPPFSLQLGNGKEIAKKTNINTVSDFRSADIELGGQGAPLVPAFHKWAFARKKNIDSVINIGGISNITVLNPNLPVIGFDIGPGNVLLDSWAKKHLNKNYDHNGNWGRKGKINKLLFKVMIKDEYFSQQGPKSTGREYFNITWLEKKITSLDTVIEAKDVQATLTELTAVSIGKAAQKYRSENVWLCGGGVNNNLLKERIINTLSDIPVHTTESLGIKPDCLEAVAFAWLAMCRMKGIKTGMPSVTGASKSSLLGIIDLAPKT